MLVDFVFLLSRKFYIFDKFKVNNYKSSLTFLHCVFHIFEFRILYQIDFLYVLSFHCLIVDNLWLILWWNFFGISNLVAILIFDKNEAGILKPSDFHLNMLDIVSISMIVELPHSDIPWFIKALCEPTAEKPLSHHLDISHKSFLLVYLR